MREAIAQGRSEHRPANFLMDPRSKFWSAHDRFLAYARLVGFGLCLVVAALAGLAGNYDKAALLIAAALLGWWWTRE